MKSITELAGGDHFKFMEVCGGHTHTIYRHGIEHLLPASVELTITETEPGVQGDRSTGGTKPATLETGATVAVPLFITTGERIRVDTRTGDYLGRVTG